MGRQMQQNLDSDVLENHRWQYCFYGNKSKALLITAVKNTDSKSRVIPCQVDQGGHDPTQFLMKLFQMKGIYEIRLSSKFQHKLRTCSKVMAPQSCHGKFKIDQTKGV